MDSRRDGTRVMIWGFRRRLYIGIWRSSMVDGLRFGYPVTLGSELALSLWKSYGV